jgi:hypothetical protein
LSGEGLERLRDTSKKRQEHFLASQFRNRIVGTVGDPLRYR